MSRLDYTFPRYNPNPEDLHMLEAMAEAVKPNVVRTWGWVSTGTGIDAASSTTRVDEIFADKIGVMLARDLSKLHPRRDLCRGREIDRAVLATDPVLLAQGVKADYWKTGHSYIKRRVSELKALAGFEKSGHFLLQHARRPWL